MPDKTKLPKEVQTVLDAAKREAIRHLNMQDYDTTCAFRRCELCQAVAAYEKSQRRKQ